MAVSLWDEFNVAQRHRHRVSLRFHVALIMRYDEKIMDIEFDDEKFGLFEPECASCDDFTRVDDVGLCSDCAGKLERDFLRERDWAYSAMAFGVPPEKREELRKLIIKEHGEALELIAPSGKKRPTTKGVASVLGHKKNKRRKR